LKDRRLVALVDGARGDEACSVIMGITVDCRGVVAPGVVGLIVSCTESIYEAEPSDEKEGVLSEESEEIELVLEGGCKVSVETCDTGLPGLCTSNFRLAMNEFRTNLASASSLTADLENDSVESVLRTIIFDNGDEFET
jgi:hypothetical protein